MIRSILNWLAPALIITVLLASCSSAPKSLEVIPEDASIVGKVDVMSLAAKGEMSELDDFKLFRTMKKELRNENKKLSRMMEDVQEDPWSTGLDPREGIYMFFSNAYDDEQFLGFTTEIRDKETFEDFLKELLKKARVDYDIDEGSTHSFTILNRESILGWDDDKLVVLGAASFGSRENMESYLESLFELKPEKQWTAHDEAKSFLNSSKDVSVVFSTNALSGEREFREIEQEMDIDLEDVLYTSHLDFEDEAIRLSFEVTPNEDMEERMNEYEVMGNGVSDDLLLHLTEDCLGAAGISINPGDLERMMDDRDENKEFQKDFEREFGLKFGQFMDIWQGDMVITMHGYENMEYTYMDWGYDFNPNAASRLDQLYPIGEAGYLSYELKEKLNAGKTVQVPRFNGRYCISIENILLEGGDVNTAINNNRNIIWYDGGWEYGRNQERTREELLPLLSLSMNISDEDFVKDRLRDFDDKIQDEGNHFSMMVDGHYPAYMAVEKGVFLVTNDKERVEVLNAGGLTDHLGKSDIGSNLQKHAVFAQMNANYDDLPEEVIQEFMGSGMLESDVEDLIKSGQIVKSVKLKSEGKMGMEIVWEMDSDGNSLHSLILAIDELSNAFLRY